MRRGNGDGSIFRLSGKRRNPFAVRITTGWTAEGRQVYSYIGYYRTKTDAKQALTEYLAKPYDIKKSSVTMDDIYRMWEAQHKLAEETFRAYSTMYRRCTSLHRRGIKEVTLVELEAVMADFTPAMKKVYRNLMKNIYKYACRYEYAERNLADMIEIDKIVSKERGTFAPQDVDKLWKNLHTHPMADIPLILLYTGMRINELLDMRSADVDLSGRMMVGGNKTDNGKERKIPIHRDIFPLVERRLAAGYKHLVTGAKGGRLNTTNYRKETWVKTVNEVVGRKTTPHETRHSFVTQAVRCGIPKTRIQKIVGHSAKDVTDHYTHSEFHELVAAMDMFRY